MFDLRRILFFIVGVLVVLALAYVFSANRSGIKKRPIVQMLVIELILAWALMKTTVGLTIVGGINEFFVKLMDYANQGTQFVFGDLAAKGHFVFYMNVLMPIIFISVLIGILRHFKILPFVIKYVGLGLSKVNGLGRLESFNAVSSLLVGQSENFIAIKQLIPHMTNERLFTLSATAISTVSMSIVGSYMQMIEPRYVVTAILLNMFSTFIILSVINPYELKQGQDLINTEAEEKKQSFFEMLGEYIMDGFKVAVVVSAMLIGFVALITAINSVFDMVFGVTFQALLGYVFSPIAYLLNIPWHQAAQAGAIMATKVVTNEFVAMIDLKKSIGLDHHTIGVISIFLVSFANFSSIGIISGAVKGLCSEKGDIVASYGFKLVYSGFLVSMLSAIVAGLMIV
ncbi:NupC/NupG family nucleoside CNT transporter [Vibrio sp. S4M6]|uniref:NupC/NupG family nucleoside CNT transporter n=1 Tax=Vibrio sinus TaxID=2946865 RepID=UPI00202AA1FB|nr:nucleoside transporter C-terminal domain-containing protein [Vibrio sinus]MCL9783540.1 NupC/NupG family nucleoside CNT transporter [Vibrio sinus]